MTIRVTEVALHGLQFAPTADIRSLIEAYDKSGAMSFEDAPGSWIKSYNDKSEQGIMQACAHCSYNAFHII